MNYILFDTQAWHNLLPLTYTRPIGEIRIGILTIREKWEKIFHAKFQHHTQEYLSTKYPCVFEDENLMINASLLPNEKLVEEIKQLKKGEALISGETVLATLLSKEQALEFLAHGNKTMVQNTTTISPSLVNHPWDIFRLNGQEIESDFKLITQGRKSAPISPSNRYLSAERIFIEENAKVEFSILNPDGGYIYIGPNAEIMENCAIRGSLALCNDSALKMSSKIYGPTTIGPHSKVGGEVNNSVIFGYSNKAHDGFLGNSVLGEWCNLGADTNNSNLKNNYAEVKVWNYPKQSFIRTGLQFCGLIMGDHSKSGINTMFNTGTSVGICSNIFGSGFPRNFVPSFSWGGASGFETYQVKKVFEVAQIVMQRRGIPLDETEKNILQHVFEMSSEFRNF